jgi:hypothetical protein
MLKKRGPGMAIILVFLALSMIITRPLITKAADSAYEEPYDPTFQAWTLAWDARALTSNPFGLFHANIFYPNPNTLAYSDHQIVTAIIAMPVLAITGNPMQTANYMLIFNLFLCAVGAYLLVVYLTDSRMAGMVAGVAFAFATPRLAHMGHLQLSAAAFIPLTLLFLHRYSEEGHTGDAVLFGFFAVLQTLSTWYYGMILGVSIIVFLIVRLIMRPRAFTLKWTATLLVVLAVAFALVVPFVIPYIRVHEAEPRFERKADEVDLFSADVRDFGAASEYSLVWGDLTRDVRKETNKRGGETERSLFPGLVPLLLGIAGAAYLFVKGRGAARFDVRYYVSLAVISFLMCLGTSLYFFGSKVDLPMPYELFYYGFPGFRAMRVPGRFIILISLSLAVLSGFAVKGMLSWLRRRSKVVLPALVSIVILGLLIVDVMSVNLPMTRVPTKDEFPQVYEWLAEREKDATAVELPLADYNPRTFVAGLQYEPTWAAREAWRTYYSILHWKKIFNGYSGYIPDNYYEGVKATRDFPSKEAVNFLKKQGVEYVIVHGKLLEPERLQSVYDWDIAHDDFNPVAQFKLDCVYRLED